MDSQHFLSNNFYYTFSTETVRRKSNILAYNYHVNNMTHDCRIFMQDIDRTKYALCKKIFYDEESVGYFEKIRDNDVTPFALPSYLMLLSVVRLKRTFIG